jgi:hypothetical protein
MKKLEMNQMEMIEGGNGVGCSEAAGMLFGAGLVLSFIPGLTPLGITILASSATGAICKD